MTDKPKRIQRKRSKGWRMPPNTVSVCRPGAWGNPFKVHHNGGRWQVGSGRLEITVTSDKSAAMAMAVKRFRVMVDGSDSMKALIRAELRGKNLACWCPVGSPCHADVLLEIANA